MWKSIALTAAILIAAAIGLDRLALSLAHVGPAWLATLLSVALALGLFVAMISSRRRPWRWSPRSFSTRSPRSSSARSIPMARPGVLCRWRSVSRSAFVSRCIAVLANIAALALTLLTGVGVAFFFILNGYLFGREYFELAAMRHLPPPQARALRRGHRGQVYLAGAVISAFLAMPILNLLTPLFATALMTRLYKRLSPPRQIGAVSMRHS